MNIIDETRRLLGPANPFPGDALAGSWDDPEGRAAYQRIISTPGPAGRRWPRILAGGRRAWWRLCWLASGGWWWG